MIPKAKLNVKKICDTAANQISELNNAEKSGLR
jgi:hypothetical protein